MVTVKDVSESVKKLGIVAGDTVIVHSSFKSLGPVDGGAETVVAGFESVLGAEGTLVMPTLVQKDFLHAHETWHLDKPSDVGYLTNYFRKLPGALRSDQATHSVAARGKNAEFLTCEHTAYGPHCCPYGDWAFADSSPWKKMYDMGAKIVFLGVGVMYNTMKHMVECWFVEELLNGVKDPARRQMLKDQLWVFNEKNDYMLWPTINYWNMEPLFEERNLVTTSQCGGATLLCIPAKESCDAMLEEMRRVPEEWCKDFVCDWIAECRKG